jgi:two-component system response regulator VicR
VSRHAILIVDDEADVRDSLGLLLELEGFEVLAAGNGAAALELLETRTPHLIISDFMMPWMNGREFVTRTKERDSTRDIPVILISGIEPAPPKPWDEFLRKPADIQVLVKLIEQLLRQRELRS